MGRLSMEFDFDDFLRLFRTVLPQLDDEQRLALIRELATASNVIQPEGSTSGTRAVSNSPPTTTNDAPGEAPGTRTVAAPTATALGDAPAGAPTTASVLREPALRPRTVALPADPVTRLEARRAGVDEENLEGWPAATRSGSNLQTDSLDLLGDSMSGVPIPDSAAEREPARARRPAARRGASESRSRRDEDTGGGLEAPSPVATADASGPGMQPGAGPAADLDESSDRQPLPLEVSEPGVEIRPEWERRLFRLFRPVRAKIRSARRQELSHLIVSSLREVRTSSRK